MPNQICFNPIGIVHSTFNSPVGTPIQPAASNGDEAIIEIFPEYTEGLNDLDGFSHIYILFHLHQITKYPLTVVPFLDTVPRGVFATRSPGRPNPIGISVVKLLKIEGSKLYIQNHDILDGSPVIDIKPYITPFDTHQPTRMGWYENRVHQMDSQKDDGRFKN